MARWLLAWRSRVFSYWAGSSVDGASPVGPDSSLRPSSTSAPLPSRLRRSRLKLEELEPRIAPSSLLYNLTLFGVMVDGPWPMVDESDATVQEPLAIDHQPSTIPRASQNWFLRESD